MKIFKWGDNFGVRIPVKVIRELNLKAGDEVNLEKIGEKTLVISKVSDDTLTP